MFEDLSLPPMYQLVRIASDDAAMDCALALARDGADPATLAWSDRLDRLECAVVLAPSEPWEIAAQIIVVGALGVGDALASVLPPGVEVGFLWPGYIVINERLAGSVELRAPEGTKVGTAPPWLVLGVELSISGEPPSVPRDSLPRTTLHYENCTEVTAAAVLESFSRHFLTWVNRWQDDGFAPVRTTWMSRTAAREGTIAITSAEETIVGKFLDLTVDGDLNVSKDNETHVIRLTDVVGL